MQIFERSITANMGIQLTVREINAMVGGQIIGDPEVIIQRPGKIEDASPGSISFLANPRYYSFVSSTKASALLVPSDYVPFNGQHPTLIKVENVYQALSTVLKYFNKEYFTNGIAETAIVDKTCSIAPGVGIGHFCIIKKGAIIGKDTLVGDQVFIGEDTSIGNGCLIYPGVKLYPGTKIGNYCIIHSNAVIGSDGFGFTPDSVGDIQKIPQIGNVVIEDNVEIGASTAIDRATMGSTIIRKGVKLDNLIQIAHNVEIGENTVIAAQTGIAGSTKIGAGCQIGGQVGIAGHLRIADGVMIQAQSGINADIKEPRSRWFGSPALDYFRFLRSYVHFKSLPSLYSELQNLKKENPHLKGKKSD